MLLQQSSDVVKRILSFVTPVQAFAALRSCRALRAAVEAAAREDLLLKTRCPSDHFGDQLEQYLRHRKRLGDRINLRVRCGDGQQSMPYGPWVDVVAVRVVEAWRLDYLDGRPSEENDDDEVATMYGEFFKLRI